MKKYAFGSLILYFALLLLIQLYSCGGNGEGGSNPGNGDDGDTSSIKLTISDNTTEALEGGQSDFYEVVLMSQPSSDVTITVSPDNQVSLGSGPGLPFTLIFTTENWNLPQIVWVTAVDDTDFEGSHYSTIRHTTSSADSRYDSYSLPDITVTLIDNDGPPEPDPTCNDAAVINDIPFNYSLGTDHIAIHTPGGVITISIGAWGAHTQPHTGHPEGNSKADWQGFFAARYDELTELEGDGDGICQRLEVCGLHSSEIDNRILEYVAPDAHLKVISVKAEGIEDTYGSDLAWAIETKLCNYGYGFGHVGHIAKDLRDKMVAAGYTDPWTVTGLTENLITGDPIFLAKDDSIGIPQIAAWEIPGHPGYYMANASLPPTATIEFPTHHANIEPFYRFLPTDLQDQLRDIMYADARNPDSFRFGQTWLVDWLWKAEMDLWTVAYTDNNDFSSIYKRLGNWWEMASGCTPGTTLCDEVFSIFPILKSTPFYEAALYDSPAVSYLVHHRQADIDVGRGFKHYEWGEVIEPANPDDLSGTMIIKWRLDHGMNPPVIQTASYQAASYQLYPDDRLLKIRWSNRVSDRAMVVTPSIPTGTEICDGVELTCHSIGWWRW